MRKPPMISWDIVYHHLQTINLYHIAPKHVRLELIPQTWQVKGEDFDKVFKCCIGFYAESRVAGCNQIHLQW